MIKTLLLGGALLVAPIVNAEEVETPIEEVAPTEETTTEEVESEKINWQEWLEKWFSPQQITLITTIATMVGTIIGLAVKLKNLVKKDNATQEEVVKLIKSELGKVLSDEVKPTLEKLGDEISKNKELNKFLVEIVALAQDDTPKSRIAILELVAKLGVLDDETIKLAKESIEEEAKEEEEKKEQAKEEVKQIIEETSESEDEVAGLRI